VPRILQQSIAMIHAGGGDAWADSTTVRPVEQEGIAGAAIAAVRAAGGSYPLTKVLAASPGKI
jgi:hypothetical protein